MKRVPIVFADQLPECDCCGEPYCPIHEMHFSDCTCVGPSNAEDDGWKIEEDENGKLWATR